MLKTFWTGIDGWADQQLPDATVIWTAPSGHTYTTLPGSQIFFPAWDTTTAALPPRQQPGDPPKANGLMMPKRRTTRAAHRARRINDERKLNDAYVAERNKPPPF